MWHKKMDMLVCVRLQNYVNNSCHNTAPQVKWFKKIVLGDSDDYFEETEKHARERVDALIGSEDKFNRIRRERSENCELKERKFAFPIKDVEPFTSFEDTMRKNPDLEVFTMSPPEYTRAARIIDKYEFNAGSSSVTIKCVLKRDAVTRIHHDQVIGINKATFKGLEDMYEAGEDAPQDPPQVKRSAKRRKV